MSRSPVRNAPADRDSRPACSELSARTCRDRRCPSAVTPTIVAFFSALSSCSRTVTSTESPTLISAPTSGESIDDRRRRPFVDGDGRADAPTGYDGRRGRESRVAARDDHDSRGQRGETKKNGSHYMTPEPAYYGRPVVGLLAVIDDVRRDQDEQIALRLPSVGHAEQSADDRKIDENRDARSC